MSTMNRKRITKHTPAHFVERLQPLVTFSTSIRAEESFTTDFQTERIPEEFRLVRGSRSVLNSLVDRSDSRKGSTTMADPEGQDPGDAELVFTAHNNHDPRCGRPPRVRNTDNPGLYHGYFVHLRPGDVDRHGLGR
jgi:hypothetical protein